MSEKSNKYEVTSSDEEKNDKVLSFFKENRDEIRSQVGEAPASGGPGKSAMREVQALRKENAQLKTSIIDLQEKVGKLISLIEQGSKE